MPPVTGQSLTLRSFRAVHEVELRDIGRYRGLYSPGDAFTSASFADPSLPDLAWEAILYPAGGPGMEKDHLGVFIRLASPMGLRRSIQVCLNLVYGTDSVSGNFRCMRRNEQLGWGKLISLDDEHLLPNPLRIYITVNFGWAVWRNEMAFRLPALAPAIAGLSDQPELADLNLQAEGLTLPVHRAVLTARSPVFAAMLAMGGAWKEGSTASLELRSLADSALVSAATLRLFRSVLYTGALGEATPISGAEMEQLMELGERYELRQLKEAAAAELARSLDKENFARRAHLAYLVDAEGLMEACAELLRREKVTGWEEFIRAHPEAAAKVSNFVARD